MYILSSRYKSSADEASSKIRIEDYIGELVLEINVEAAHQKKYIGTINEEPSRVI